MSISITAPPLSGARFGHAYCERFWYLSGIQFIGLLIVAAIIRGYQPAAVASPGDLFAYYDGHRRILVYAVISAVNLLNLLWFTAALRNSLANAGAEAWGAAATVSGAAFASIFLIGVSIEAAIAYAIAPSGDLALTSGLNNVAWAVSTLQFFARAMLIMAGVFGLWRVGLISNSLFTSGVIVAVLALFGGATWLSSGLWAPDGAYARILCPALLLIWIAVVSKVLLSRASRARGGW
jgi:hypothetical protein